LEVSSEPSGSRSKEEGFEMGTHEAVKEVGSVNKSSDTASHSPPPAPITLAVYRDLRVGLAVTAVMLAAAIIIQWIATDCWQAALSEYFYTSAHSIFIAALLGLATLFFVYRGSSDTEDALLTLAGVAALTAALVPQGRPEVCKPSFLPVDVDVEAVVRPNLVAVVVALVLGWALMIWQHRYNRSRQTRSAGGTLALYFLRLVVAGGLIVLVFWPKEFSKYAHGTAGVLMLSAFIATVFSSAYLAKREERSPDRYNYRWFYQVIGQLMLVTLIAVITVHIRHPELFGLLWVTILESALILEFGAYWVVQTIDLWDSPDRSERLPDADRKLLAQGRTTRGLAGLKSELVEARKAPPGQRLLPLL
jgi:hypothetical protein